MMRDHQKKEFNIDYLHMAGGNDQPLLSDGRLRLCFLVNVVRMVGPYPATLKPPFDF